MLEFTICLAGKRIGICCEYERTRNYCADYLTREPADFCITCGPEDLLREQELALKSDPDCGCISPALLEQAAVYRKIADRMIEYDTLLFHGSVVSLDGEGYLFTAPSGTGKSTHVRLWREVFGHRAVTVNDDKPLLKITENGVYACGTPWNGKHRLGENICVPLKAICILERGEENQIASIPAKEALLMLMQQSNRPRNPKLMPKYMELIDALARKTSFYRLACNMEPDVARVAYETMSGKERT